MSIHPSTYISTATAPIFCHFRHKSCCLHPLPCLPISLFLLPISFLHLAAHFWHFSSFSHSLQINDYFFFSRIKSDFLFNSLDISLKCLDIHPDLSYFRYFKPPSINGGIVFKKIATSQRHLQ